MTSLFGLDPATYQPSALHHPDRIFPQTNCYADLWIELLHAQGISPESIMAFTCRVDFEGDQWTFFKPPPEELLRLHGIDVHEMQLYRPAADHVLEQVRAGRTMTLEVDSFYLPDTAASSYRRAHVKSSIAVEAIDPAQRRLRYFHGAGFYELAGDDYSGVFRLDRHFSDDVLPPYVELVNFRAGPRLEGVAARIAAIAAPPVDIQAEERIPGWCLASAWSDLPALLAGSDERSYHAYAFATVRQCGAAFETARSFVEWLVPSDSLSALAAADALGRQVSGAKTLLFKLARRRAFNPADAIAELAAAWDEGDGCAGASGMTGLFATESAIRVSRLEHGKSRRPIRNELCRFPVCDAPRSGRRRSRSRVWRHRNAERSLAQRPFDSEKQFDVRAASCGRERLLIARTNELRIVCYSLTLLWR